MIKTLLKLIGSRLANSSGVILLILRDEGECDFNRLKECTKLCDRALFAALSSLKEQGLVAKRKEGKKHVFYYITRLGLSNITPKTEMKGLNDE